MAVTYCDPCPGHEDCENFVGRSVTTKTPESYAAYLEYADAADWVVHVGPAVTFSGGRSCFVQQVR